LTADKTEKLDERFEEMLELIETKHYGELHKHLSSMNPSDISDFLSEYVPKELLVLIFRITPKSLAADAFAYLEPDVQAEIINGINDREVADLISDLYLDDAADLLEELPANVVKRILRNVSADTRDQINQFLQYPENSAGSIMTAEFVDLKKKMTVSDALTRVRRIGADKETIYIQYVVDENRKLEGVISARELLLSSSDAVIGEIMHTDIISVATQEDREVVSEVCSRYDLLAVPVVDSENRLVGIVTVDDVIDVLQEEATEDFELMAAMKPSEKPYLKTGVFSLARNRILWLLLLMISATFTSSILLQYEDMFAIVPLLVALMPVLTDTGGNAGSQAATLVIRGMAVGDIEPADFFRVLWKEIRVSVIVGVVLAAVNFVRIAIFYPDSTQIAFVVSLALLSVVMMSKAFGCTLPIIAKVCRVDPAIMAAPLITTIVDACAMLLYFSIAQAILKIR